MGKKSYLTKIKTNLRCVEVKNKERAKNKGCYGTNREKLWTLVKGVEISQQHLHDEFILKLGTAYRRYPN